jgi:AmiR/NasT family two-component response regulator
VPDSEDLATALFLARREIANLKEALSTRTVIGQALGILMAQGTISDDAAFALLRQTSSHTNVKLRDLAAALVREANEGSQDRQPVLLRLPRKS